MFRIRAEYSEQFELRTSLDCARAFFGELRNVVDLMPGIENIRSEANGIKRWMVRADVPMLGSMREAFAVELTEDSPHRLEYSPAAGEKSNFLRYVAAFEERGAKTLVRIAQRVEMRRPNARDLHMFAGLVGEGRLSAEMQKRVAEMIKTFLQRARAKLEV